MLESPRSIFLEALIISTENDVVDRGKSLQVNNNDPHHGRANLHEITCPYMANITQSEP